MRQSEITAFWKPCRTLQPWYASVVQQKLWLRNGKSSIIHQTAIIFFWDQKLYLFIGLSHMKTTYGKTIYIYVRINDITDNKNPLVHWIITYYLYTLLFPAWHNPQIHFLMNMFWQSQYIQIHTWAQGLGKIIHKKSSRGNKKF